MNKVLFFAGMFAVFINVTFGISQGAELALFGVGMMFAVGFNWISNWMGL